MRRHPLISCFLVLVVLVVGAGAALGVVARRDLSAVSNSQSHKVLFTIAKGETVSQVAASLQNRGLIRSSFFFKYFAETKSLQDALKPGRFELDPGMDAQEVVDVLKGPPLSRAFNVTIPDGLRLAKEAEILQTYGLFSAASYLKVAAAATALPGITPLAGTPAGAGWEGFAFGDTYQVLPKTTPTQMLARQLEDFNARVGVEITKGAAAVAVPIRGSGAGLNRFRRGSHGQGPRPGGGGLLQPPPRRHAAPERRHCPLRAVLGGRQQHHRQHSVRVALQHVLEFGAATGSHR